MRYWLLWREEYIGKKDLWARVKPKSLNVGLLALQFFLQNFIDAFSSLNTHTRKSAEYSLPAGLAFILSRP